MTLQLGGMGGRMDLLQLLDANLGVDLGGAQFGVSPELLDEPGVGSAFQHQRGAGVAQQVARAAFAEVGGVEDVFWKPLFQTRKIGFLCRHNHIQIVGRPPESDRSICAWPRSVVLQSSPGKACPNTTRLPG